MRRSGRGAGLVEALLAFVVLSLGMLALARLQTALRQGSELARQRAEGGRLVEADIEQMRTFARLAAVPGAPSYADIASRQREVDAASLHGNTGYRLQREVVDDADAGLKRAHLTAAWTDRTGSARQLAVDALIARSDPLLSAALVVAPRRHSLLPIAGRSAQLPPLARDLGNGRSVLKPVHTGNLAFVFDNTSGRIVALCRSIAATLTTRTIGAADVAGCDAADAVLLSGLVRRSTAVPPDAASANDAPLPLDIALTLSGGPYTAPPVCAAEAQKRVTYGTPQGLQRDAVPVDALPASLGLAGWSDSGERFVAYHCAVTPAADGRWSGRSRVVPNGWTIGTTPASQRVCRYAADQDGSGGVDSNPEHPAAYRDVESALMQQNFLLVRGDQPCPGSAGAGVVADLATAQHQP